MTKDARQRGIEMVQEIYGGRVRVDPERNAFSAVSADHLFGSIWTRSNLSIRDRRLLTIGVLAMLGKGDTLQKQFEAALERSELTVAELEEVVLHLAHYVGWPLGTIVDRSAESAKRASTSH